MPLFDNPIFVSLLMLVWGLVVKYLPAMKPFPNRLIVWCNVLIGILAKLISPEPAHAGFFGDLGHNLGMAIVPVEAAIARGIYETFVRPTLESIGILGYPAEPVVVKPKRKRKKKVVKRAR